MPLVLLYKLNSMCNSWNGAYLYLHVKDMLGNGNYASRQQASNYQRL